MARKGHEAAGKGEDTGDRVWRPTLTASYREEQSADTDVEEKFAVEVTVVGERTTSN